MNDKAKIIENKLEMSGDRVGHYQTEQNLCVRRELLHNGRTKLEVRKCIVSITESFFWCIEAHYKGYISTHTASWAWIIEECTYVA